jgi:O-methyltransferase
MREVARALVYLPQMALGLKRIFHNRYLDRLALSRLPVRFHALYKLFRYDTYDSERVSMMHRAATWLSVNGVTGSVCEFGCAGGESFLNLYLQFARIFSPTPHFFLFDSFEGLPEPDDKTAHAAWKKGTYRMDRDLFVQRMDFFRVPRSAYTITKGFYQESLLTQTARTLPIGPLALLHIDCDFYESTLLALEFVTKNLQDGSIVLFDDYYCSKGNPSLGESGAFLQWLSSHLDWSAVPWYDYSIHGKAFVLSRIVQDAIAPRS